MRNDARICRVCAEKQKRQTVAEALMQKLPIREYTELDCKENTERARENAVRYVVEKAAEQCREGQNLHSEQHFDSVIACSHGSILFAADTPPALVRV